MILHSHLNVNEKGHLTIGGMDTVTLAKEFGIRTIPVLVMDGIKSAPTDPIADVVTVTDEAELDTIDRTLLRILTGAPPAAMLSETQTRSAHADM